MRSPTGLQTLLTPSTHYPAEGYLAASGGKHQPLCGNKEGWGPLSPYRYDFTPCFLDVWILVVAVFGIVAGAGALWYLLKKCHAEPVKKNWHFYAKLVRSSLVASVMPSCGHVLTVVTLRRASLEP